MRRLTALCFAAVALAACDGPIGPTNSPDVPNLMIQDGAHNGGNPHFFWLPPLVPNPVTNGVFNGELAVDLEICQLDGNPALNPAAACDFSVTPIHFGPEQIRVSMSDQQYHVNWNTDGLNTNAFYRLSAYVGTDPVTRIRLGLVDFDPVDKGMKNVRTGEVVAFQEGRTIPVKFRVEQGVLCPNGECIERTVTQGAPGEEEIVQYVEVVDGIANAPLAGVSIPTEAFPPGVEQLTIRIEKIRTEGGGVPRPGVLCHPTLPLEQFDGCFEISTIPELPALDESGRQFAAPITVAVCFELHETSDPRESFVQLYASDPGEEARALPTATHLGLMPIHEALDCGEAFASNERANPLMRFARSVGRSLGKVFGVKSAYAVDLGLGGLTEALSNIGPALTARLEQVGDVERTVDGGGSTVFAARVLGTTHHNDEAVLDEPIPGMPVIYTVAAGHGSISDPALEEDEPGAQRTIVTNFETDDDGEFDGGGFAPVRWHVPETPGTYTMTATAAAFDSPKTYTVTVEEAESGDLPDLIVESFTVSPDPNVAEEITVTAVVRNIGDGSAGESNVMIDIGGESVGNAPQFPVPALAPGATHTVQRVFRLQVAQGYENHAVADIGDVVAEANEENNDTELNFIVRALTGTGVDPAGDAPLVLGEIPGPDFISASATMDDEELRFSIRYAGSTYDPATTAAVLYLDTDRNPLTGCDLTGGVEGTGLDAAQTGCEYLVNVAHTIPLATLFRRLPGGGFETLGSVSITSVTNGNDFTFPLSMFGAPIGAFDFKLVSQYRLSESGFTGILDVITNVGSPAIPVVPFQPPF